eukprot:CAMPEP_0171491868 /NCGR_PEP_ID=MMETSP0958-20121227/4095_1 /TAXON_ID=87120 /ORGANISM="Aurantiochytrium limacinum, Strain ATCCMYA-1381" /LENGTH=451 /DNA_ID=CAMNT_0012025327 /DNA_START=297 /DNA_END=1652 /DNA_ORIENTATION=-
MAASDNNIEKSNDVVGNAGGEDVKRSIDKEQFEEKLNAIGLRLDPRNVGGLMKTLKRFTVRGRGRRSVVEDQEHADKKVIVLDPAQVSNTEDLAKILSEEERERAGAEIIDVEVRQGYDNLSAEQILRKLIPAEIKELPASFETVGHLAHVNLREEVLPWRYQIGQVILDKNPVLRTVVNKIGSIENQFRTFPMEVIAGEENTEVEVKQYGCTFRFNFADVYWNSRLHEEHRKLVTRFKPGQILVDAFCGVGPFAVPAAQEGVKVYASDLNPKSYESLVQNVKVNKVEDLVVPSNEDARVFIRRTLADGVLADHFVMNLPASGLEFLDAFRGAFSRERFSGAIVEDDRNGMFGESSSEDDGPDKKRAKVDVEDSEQASASLKPLPLVHCYCFSSADDFKEDIILRAEKSLGSKLSRELTDVRQVRDVAPRKMMYCLHFRVPEEAAFAVDAC